jgi:hypothetical protein
MGAIKADLSLPREVARMFDEAEQIAVTSAPKRSAISSQHEVLCSSLRSLRNSQNAKPPSASMILPVTQRLSFDVKNATASATSSGWPRRPNAVLAIKA